MTGTNDKLRGLFLAVLMVVSVFAGTIALTGTAAAANNEVSVSDATEANGDLTIEFNQSIERDGGAGTPGQQDLNASNVEVYIRDAGSGDFVEWNGTTRASAFGRQIQDSDVYTNGNNLTLDGANTWNDLSPADEVKVEIGRAHV